MLSLTRKCKELCCYSSVILTNLGVLALTERERNSGYAKCDLRVPRIHK